LAQRHDIVLVLIVVAVVVEGPLSVFVAQYKFNLALTGGRVGGGRLEVTPSKMVGPLIRALNEYFNNAMSPAAAAIWKSWKSLELLCCLRLSKRNEKCFGK